MGTYVAIDTTGKLHVSDQGYSDDDFKQQVEAWNDDNAGNFGDTFPTLKAGQSHVSILSDGYVRNIAGRQWVGHLTMPEFFHSG